jgi:preprotein translocase subunit SecA
VDTNDQIYKSQREKYKALVDEVIKRHSKGQPVLLGTVTVETSEVLSRLLRLAKIPHNVLNAKNHAREAEIVSLAGQPGAVTIATNMAGRGTDIKLGAGVVWVPETTIKSQLKLADLYDGGKDTLREMLLEKPCGLHVIGSERHESRRIDRQLRGRCGRQGDPGSSQFYISLEDPLMRLFGSDKIASIMTRLGMEEGEALEHKWLNRSVETAQRRVEQQNYAIRKRTLEYDDVMNKQRSVVYELRGQVLMSESAHEHILDVFNDLILTQCEKYLMTAKDSQPADLVEWVTDTFPIPLTLQETLPFKGEPEKAAELIYDRVAEAYELKCTLEDQRVLPFMERGVFLSCIDQQWQDYLRAMDELRHGVNLRAYGQRDPLVEYKREAFGMFEALMTQIKTEVATSVFRATTVQNYQRMMAQSPVRIQTTHADMNMLAGGEQPPAEPHQRQVSADVPQSAVANFDAMLEHMSDKPRQSTPQFKNDMRSIGRNDACPCGSGKKYKKCCGQGL